MYNLIEYSDNYSKSSGILQQYCGDEPASVANNGITVFNAANAITNLFNNEAKVKGQTGENGIKYVEVMLPLKYLTNFW